MVYIFLTTQGGLRVQRSQTSAMELSFKASASEDALGNKGKGKVALKGKENIHKTT